MLPTELPALPHLEIAAFMRTATEVGGDYYDFMVQDDGVLNVAFGDATGHGLQAGTMVTLMKGLFTSDSAKLGLQEFMTHCNKIIKEIRLGRIFMSFCYMKIEQKKLQISNAGMPPVFFHNKEKNTMEEILIQGMPLGSMRSAQYRIVERDLNTGDTILLLSDGLPEQMNSSGEMLEYERLKRHFQEALNYSPDKIIKKLVDAGDTWRERHSQDDDISFVVIRAK
jgi:serine phosphatase RsbU (regulator of sigma subunit)